MQLHPRAVAYFMLQRILLWIVFGIWFGLILLPRSGTHYKNPNLLPGFHFDMLGGFALAAALALGVIVLVNGVFAYLKASSYRYAVEPEGVVLEYGVLNKSHEILLYNNVQDIIIRRGLLERLMGLSTLVIQNAMGRTETIPALDPADAEQLRDEIVQRARH
jgi:membrane protein YdbS with pleckstrin-like domain